jgi:stage III sporulation protein AD
MNILQIVSFAIVAAILALLVREHKPIFASFILMIAGLLILYSIVAQLAGLIGYVAHLAERTSMDASFLKIIIKMIGISYLAEIGAQVVRDTGQESLAQKIELSAKVILLYMALPIATAVIEKIIAMFPS